MPQRISEGDFIVLETNKSLQACGTVGESVFVTKKVGVISFSLFKGLLFHRWYEIGEGGKLFEAIFDEEMHSNILEKDPSTAKNEARKENKKRKLVKAKPLCPEALLEYYVLKNHSVIRYIGHPELSYMSLFIRNDEKTLVLDFKKGFFSYNVLYKNRDADLTTITNSEYFLLRYVSGRPHKVAPFEHIDTKFDTFFVLDDCDVCKVLDFYRNNFCKAFVYFTSRSYAVEVFHALLEDPLYVDVNMRSFFCREYQTNENVHPLVRSNVGSGYVVSAVSVLE